jgi:hypothetical protein
MMAFAFNWSVDGMDFPHAKLLFMTILTAAIEKASYVKAAAKCITLGKKQANENATAQMGLDNSSRAGLLSPFFTFGQSANQAMG